MAKNILIEREHPVLEAREHALALNALAFNGGAPYIEKRLSRFPAETDVDFFGDRNHASQYRIGEGARYSAGRLERAFLVNYARRIAEKVAQYVHASPPQREGINELFERDATATGQSLSQLMYSLVCYLIQFRWCWLGVDRPAATPGASVAESEGRRVYWKLYAPHEVRDWSFDASGGLRWAITEEKELIADSPRMAPVERTVRFLMERGVTTRLDVDEKGETVRETPVPHSYDGVPLVPVGLISADPWWFDDVERIQRSIMDKQSALDTAIFKSVFPLLVAPQSLAESAQLSGTNTQEARRKISIANPITESADEKGITRWLTGTSTDLQLIRSEISAMRQELYDVVGLNMSVPESRQVASAEAKAFDHLDISAVLANYATVCEEAEKKAVEISTALDSGFAAWEPKYVKSYDVKSFAESMKAITEASAINLPPAGERLLLRAAIRSIAAEFGVSDSERDAAIEEADNAPDNTDHGIKPPDKPDQPGPPDVPPV